MLFVTIRLTLGVIFLILALIGALLPVMQGWMFFLLSLLMFFPSHPRVAAALGKFEPKLPNLVCWLRKLGIGEAIRRSHDRRHD
jgi:uncharacterized membrane protein YbaN (DUF454 family)